MQTLVPERQRMEHQLGVSALSAPEQPGGTEGEGRRRRRRSDSSGHSPSLTDTRGQGALLTGPRRPPSERSPRPRGAEKPQGQNAELLVHPRPRDPRRPGNRQSPDTPRASGRAPTVQGPAATGLRTFSLGSAELVRRTLRVSAAASRRIRSSHTQRFPQKVWRQCHRSSCSHRAVRISARRPRASGSQAGSRNLM